MNPILRIHNLETRIETAEGPIQAVNQVSLTVPRGMTLGLVGESGCGKTMTALSVLGLIRYPARIVGGEIWFFENGIGRPTDGTVIPSAGIGDVSTNLSRGGGSSPIDLLRLSRTEMRRVRGRKIAMIFQEPMIAFNPVLTIGSQIIEAIQTHEILSNREAKGLAIEALRAVSVPMPEQRLMEYPHQLSGGLRQRAMIAMALVLRPSLLIADEPTTALDVTIQAQILDLLERLKTEFQLSLLIISHDLAVVSKIADEVCIMYAGRIVEQGPARSVFQNPRHPYTEALMRAFPQRVTRRGEGNRLQPIPGSVPDLRCVVTGCAFQPRCRYEMGPRCSQSSIELTQVSPGWRVRCVKYV